MTINDAVFLIVDRRSNPLEKKPTVSVTRLRFSAVAVRFVGTEMPFKSSLATTIKLKLYGNEHVVNACALTFYRCICY